MPHTHTDTDTPPLPDPAATALFLDLDGTLAEIRPDPAQVAVPGDTLATLARLARALQGALAVLSGRAGEELDRLLHPLVLPHGANHGAVRREAGGRVTALPAPASLPAVTAQLRDAVAGWSGVRLEPKPHGVAVHYRQAPERAAAVDALVREMARAHAPDYAVQPGKMVVELRPAGADKGEALRSFMRSPPYAGRTPVMVGDDVTDEAAFAAAQDLGGYGVKVGPGETAARWRLADPAAVAAWLGRWDSGSRARQGEQA
ncbi:trehalose-phosphatase [Bordetella sp. 2513F-2]